MFETKISMEDLGLLWMIDSHCFLTQRKKQGVHQVTRSIHSKTDEFLLVVFQHIESNVRLWNICFPYLGEDIMLQLRLDLVLAFASGLKSTNQQRVDYETNHSRYSMFNVCVLYQPWVFFHLKIQIESKDHPIEMQNYLNQASMTLGSRCMCYEVMNFDIPGFSNFAVFVHTTKIDCPFFEEPH